MRRPDHIGIDVSRRTVIKSTTAGMLAAAGIGTASADDEDEEEEEENDESEDEEESDDDENDEDDEDEGEEGDEEDEEDGEDDRSASVSISDQEIGGDSVEVTDVSLSQDGYMSIHDISRFSGGSISDVDEIDEIPERDNPICGSIVGITELLEAGDYDELEVPLYTEEAPAVGEFGHFSEGSLPESQPLIAIPHLNDTDEDEFVCDGDPPADGAIFDSGTVDSLPVVNDIATVTLESDSDGAKERAEALTEAILDGRIALPNGDEEVEQAEDEEELEEEEEDNGDEDDEGEDEEDEEELEEEEDDDDEDNEDEKEGDDDDDEDEEDEEDDEDDEEEKDDDGEDEDESDDDEEEGEADEDDEDDEDEDEGDDDDEEDDDDDE
jgi:hypothetical protein